MPVAAVTGGTGFVGRHVVAALAASGWRLRLLVRRNPGLDIGAEPVDLVPGSLDDPAALDALVTGADAVIHLAGAIKGADRAAFDRVNRDGTAALAAAWRRRAPEARFVLLSSLAAREPGLSAYAASKAAGEHALRAVAGAQDGRGLPIGGDLHGGGGFQNADGGWDGTDVQTRSKRPVGAKGDRAAPSGGIAILRPGAVYGPGDRETLGLFRAAGLPVQPMLNGTRARVCLIHAADLAAAVVAAASAPLPGPGPYALSDARRDGYGWLELVAAACAARGTRCRPWRLPAPLLHLAGWGGDAAAALHPRDAPMLTSGKRREILHADWSMAAEADLPADLWQPRIALAEGFAETVAWYRAQGWLPPAPPA
jgi:nucleoside-diphosphate-sugar epimerase